jgi:hypothetical protein
MTLKIGTCSIWKNPTEAGNDGFDKVEIGNLPKKFYKLDRQKFGFLYSYQPRSQATYWIFLAERTVALNVSLSWFIYV